MEGERTWAHKLFLISISRPVVIFIVLQMLLEYGARTDVSNVFGDTPLSKALKDRLYDQTHVIDLLLKYGADPNFEPTITNNSRRKGPSKPIFAAIENGQLTTPFITACNMSSKTKNIIVRFEVKHVCYSGDRSMVDRLLQHGASLSQLDYQGFCPIMPCLSNGVSIALLRYITGIMDDHGISYDISGWPYLQQAFQWQV